MDCCGGCNCHGHAFTRRQWMWGTVVTSVGAMLAGGIGMRGTTAAAQTAENTTAALDVLRNPSLSMYTRMAEPPELLHRHRPMTA